MKKVKRFIKKIMPRKMLNFIRRHRKRKVFSEEQVSYGAEHPDKTFFVIRRPLGAGLFSDYNFFLGYIIYADKKGWIPIIDMQNYPNNYKEDSPINNITNAWVYYFEQPGGYTLEDISKAQNVVLSSGDISRDNYDYSLNYFAKYDKEEISRLHSYVKKYIRLKEHVKERVDRYQQQFFGVEGNIVGVSYRGTAYRTDKPSGHQIQPSLDETISKIEELRNKWQFNKIFFTAEEKEMVDKVKKHFESQDITVIINERPLIEKHIKDMDEWFFKFNRENDKYLSGLEYLTEVILLSRCDYLISGATNGPATACVMNGGEYKDAYIFDLGIFD